MQRYKIIYYYIYYISSRIHNWKYRRWKYQRKKFEFVATCNCPFLIHQTKNLYFRVWKLCWIKNKQADLEKVPKGLSA